MGDEKDSPKETYELSPLEPPPPVAVTRSAPEIPAVSPTGAPPSPPTGKGALLDDFDEDADFSRDPEVERALRGIKGAIAGEPRRGDARPVFVKPGNGTAQVWLIVGAVLLLGAVIAAAVNTAKLPVIAAVLVVYNACLHAVTGVGAIAVGALLTDRRVGSLNLAGARMFSAVSAFLLVWNLRITLLGGPAANWEEWTLATIVYVGAVAGLFRLWGRELAYVLCSHFLLWIVFHVGMWLSETMSRSATGV